MADKERTVVLNQAPGPSSGPGTTNVAALVHLHPSGVNLGRRYPLEKQEILVGREGEVDVRLEYASVSRRQARIINVLGNWVLEDLGSTNGTFVNEKRVQSSALQSNDLIRFGEVIVKFLFGSDIEAAYHEEIYRVSIQDGLTGAFNKRYLLDLMERELARSIRYTLPLGLVMFDVDHFKRVNDNYGHLAGDAVLKELVRRLAQRIRQTDLLGRYGGEEFAVVLPSTDQQGAIAIAESLRHLMQATPVEYEGVGIPVTISLGVTALEPWASPPVDTQELIRRADERLYAAKRAGRNRVMW
ncbi:diguanylate cyclase [Chondromyces crocatus]|uniref:diguanylate cyclase n=2 Tax=Chondromyces crocatus TaxID=52 RepID=A0A0K1ELJ9_CHOCO|nr:diguanylate cyclase [Chondromyces crocatus]